MSVYYPFTKCLKPRRILNPYTNESHVVSCGKCPACLLRKSSMNAMKCKLESLSHKYTMFITCTYTNASIPLMRVSFENRYKDDCGEVEDNYSYPVLRDITQRLGTQGTELGRCYNTYILDKLARKVERPRGILPHLSKYDAQLFIKRLRINLDRYFIKKYGRKAEKIRYYLVGEYGAVHYRPHIHLELWFSDDETYKVIREIVYKSWPYGSIRVEKSLGKSADYVAKYLNSSVSLPRVFKEFGTAPFCLHSAHLGEKVLEVSREEILSKEYTRIISRRIVSVNADSDIFLWRSLKTYYFPKCKGYTKKSQYERLFSYKTYGVASSWLGTDCCAAQARRILIACFGVLCHDERFMRRDTALIEYFIRSAGVVPISLIAEGELEDICRLYYQAIYMELRTSKHYMYTLCKGDYNMMIRYLDIIDDFWKYNDSLNVAKQYQDMQDFSLSEFFETESDYQYFFHNRGFECKLFEKTKASKLYHSMVKLNYENAVKHKKLNDLNKVFDNK